jgi:hypothetical protein
MIVRDFLLFANLGSRTSHPAGTTDETYSLSAA